MKIETKLISSLVKVYPDMVNGETLTSISAMKNESFSFQIAYKNKGVSPSNLPLYIKVESDFNIDIISEYKVGYVPVTNSTVHWNEACRPDDDYYDREIPAGLFPDVLIERNVDNPIENDGFWSTRFFEKDEENTINSLFTWQALWFTVNEKSSILNTGKYNISVVFYNAFTGNEIGREKLAVEIIDSVLPKQELIYTSWFHYDCLADIYGVEIFSDEHFELIKKFVEKAVDTGMNMILLPAFTPPLDTPVGKERKTTQLVDISLENNEYKFDFSLLQRFIKICISCGIEYFEHCHMFTQWGARFAPKIIAKVNGEQKQIFGWDTDSRSKEYSEFLKAYLSSVIPFFDSIGLKGKVFFHISDEPTEKNMEYYNNANSIIKSKIENYPSGDAITYFKFFEQGLVETPIVSVDSPDMDKFISDCNSFWVYTCGETLHSGYSNRIISIPGARNRIIGVQMYVSNAKGYLHWGYNYYYDVLSHGLFNPLNNPCGYGGIPGTSFMIYPNINGDALISIRMKLFYEAINDQRALILLEKNIGREKVLQIVNKHFGKVSFNITPTNEQLIKFREDINSEIKKSL